MAEGRFLMIHTSLHIPVSLHLCICTSIPDIIHHPDPFPSPGLDVGIKIGGVFIKAGIFADDYPHYPI